MRLIRLAAAVFAAAVLILIACQVQETEQAHTITITALRDSLAKFDSVKVSVQSDGREADVVLTGKVDDKTRLDKLAAPHYDGKHANITIIGYKDHREVFRASRSFDGETNKVGTVVVFMHPDATLNSDSLALSLLEGDSLGLPGVRIQPANLDDPSLSWTSLDTELVAVRGKFLIGLSRGNAKVNARLKSDLSKELLFAVRVMPNATVPDSVVLSPDTLKVAAQGASARFVASFRPASARAQLTFESLDAGIAAVTPEGSVAGLAKGLARVKVTAKARLNPSDTAWVLVGDPVAVSEVRFTVDSMELFTGGATDSLRIRVFPAEASQQVAFTVADPAIAREDRGRAEGLKAGQTWIVASSRQNPSAKDSLRVLVYPAEKVESLALTPPSIRIFTGGQTYALDAKVVPASAFPKVRWVSLKPEVANVDGSGVVSPMAPGKALIIGMCLADSLVRDTVEVAVDTDIPEIDPGADTTIPPDERLSMVPGIKQEYGGITRFWWDLNGDGKYEDSAASIKPVEFSSPAVGRFRVGFKVRDGEGNIDTASRGITVKAKPVSLVIVQPGRDTLVNRKSITIAYKVNGVRLETKWELHDSLNLVVLDTTTDSGSAADTIRIVLDTVKPDIRFQEPKDGQWVAKDSIKVAWSVDGNAQSTLLFQKLIGGDGAKTITRSFRDEAGNLGERSITVKLDTKLPAVAIKSPKDSSFTRFVSIPVDWTVDGAARNDSAAALREGLNTVVRTAVDSAGNRDSASVRVYLLTAKPNVKIDGPSEGSVVAQDSVRVYWSVGGVSQTADTTAKLAAGSNTIKRSFTDAAGNVGVDSVRVSYKQDAPVVKITSPLPGTATNQAVIQVEWTVNGNAMPAKPDTLAMEGENTITRRFTNVTGDEGVDNVKVIRDTQAPKAPSLTAGPAIINQGNKSAVAAWTWTAGGDNGLGGMPVPRQFRYRLNGDTAGVLTSASGFSIATPAEGVQTLVVQERDKAGNWSPFSAPQSITVDRIPPALVILTGNSPNAYPIWTWNAGAGDGTRKFRYRLNSGSLSAETSKLTFVPGSLPPGNHTLVVQERDAVGNWSPEASVTVLADDAQPVVPTSGDLACVEPGTATDSLDSFIDEEGYHLLFDGKSFKGWGQNCKTTHSGNSPLGAIFRIDPNSHSIMGVQRSTTIGGLLATNKGYLNYEIVFSMWAGFTADAGIFNRTTATGRCYQTALDYINGASMGGIWGEGGFPNRDIRPFKFGSSAQAIGIPGNPSGELNNWTTITSKLNPGSFGCPASGCTQVEWLTLWDFNGWNDIKVQFYGATPTTPAMHMKSWFKKPASSAWVPLLQDTTYVPSPAIDRNPIGFQVHGGGRHPSPVWYRSIRIREVDESGNPILP